LKPLFSGCVNNQVVHINGRRLDIIVAFFAFSLHTEEELLNSRF
jgi:hypothetical protein